MIKTFIKTHQTTLLFILFSLAIFGVISLFSESVAKPVATVEPEVYIVPVDGQKRYDLKAEAVSPEYPNQKLSFSLFFPASVVHEKKYGGRETLFYYKGQKVAVLNFYYFPEKITTFDFAKNILGQKYTLAIDTTERLFSNTSYITASQEKSYYRIGSFKDGKWIVMLEVLAGNDKLESEILNSLRISE